MRHRHLEILEASGTNYLCHFHRQILGSGDTPVAIFHSTSEIPMPGKTLFQKICDKEILADIVHEDDLSVAFRDISPQAPVHILIVPRQAIPRIAEATDPNLVGHLLLTAAHIARAENIAETGFRIAINNGPDGGESVPHLHVHLLGGRPLAWPPG